MPSAAELRLGVPPSGGDHGVRLPEPRKRGTPNKAAIEIKTIPWVRALSLAAAWLASVASHSLVALSSCAVHTLVFAYAWLVHGVVVPRWCSIG